MPSVPARPLRGFLLALLACAAGRLHGQAGMLVPTSSGRPDAAVLALREMAVDVGLARGYARVNVRQVFENRTGTIQEGSYRFALPPSAAVGDFAIWDGLQRIPGVILEKRRARSIYQELARQAIAIGAGTLWLQLGITSPEARQIAEEAGLTYLENICIGETTRRLGVHPRA